MSSTMRGGFDFHKDAQKMRKINTNVNNPKARPLGDQKVYL